MNPLRVGVPGSATADDFVTRSLRLILAGRATS